ncbi:hypothetical protein L842_6037 [Mycobacterium intracellulare MIN_052511_1280]|nr:hypothetical protein L842_6037 [Mycobacterium intracellulare MIN_052511_1280]
MPRVAALCSACGGARQDGCCLRHRTRWQFCGQLTIGNVTTARCGRRGSATGCAFGHRRRVATAALALGLDHCFGR